MAKGVNAKKNIARTVGKLQETQDTNKSRRKAVRGFTADIRRAVRYSLEQKP